MNKFSYAKKCPTLVRWSKHGKIEIKTDKLIKHWKICKICQYNLKLLKRMELQQKSAEKECAGYDGVTGWRDEG